VNNHCGKHKANSFSRYVFSLSSVCKNCHQKLYITPTTLTGALWVAIILALALYLIHNKEYLDFFEFAMLWVVLSYGARLSMAFVTKEEYVAKSKKSQPFIFFYALATLQIFSLMIFTFGIPFGYVLALLGIVFVITPLSYASLAKAKGGASCNTIF